MNRVIWYVMTNLVGWANPIVPKSSSPESLEEPSLLEDWEWMLSSAEEIAQKQNQKDRELIQAEVSALKRVTSTLSHRKELYKMVAEYWRGVSERERLVLSSKTLDACKRDKVIKDVVKSLSQSWLDSLKVSFSLPETFSQNWHQEKYKKNTIGEIISFAFTASNIGFYNEKTCTDIIWAIYLCLGRNVSQSLVRALTPKEDAFICSLLMPIPEKLTTLWLQTLVNMGAVEQRSGTLPERWKQEEQVSKKKLQELKSLGVSARYEDGPNDPLRQMQLSKSLVLEKPQLGDSVATKRDFLNKSLILRAPKKP